jgi:hypothetical protein
MTKIAGKSAQWRKFMETVLQALTAMESATADDISARLDVDKKQVIDDLWELKRSGVVTRTTSGAWKLLVDGTPEDVTTEPEGPLTQPVAQPAAKIGEPEITTVLRHEGSKTAEELAYLFDTTARKIASTLAMAVSKGRLQRVNQGGKFRYCLPDATPAPEAPAAELVTTGEAHEREPVAPVVEKAAPAAVDAELKELAPVAPVVHQNRYSAQDFAEINRDIRTRRRDVVRLTKMRRAMHTINRNEKNLLRWASEIAEVTQ